MEPRIHASCFHRVPKHSERRPRFEKGVVERQPRTRDHRSGLCVTFAVHIPSSSHGGEVVTRAIGGGRMGQQAPESSDGVRYLENGPRGIEKAVCRHRRVPHPRSPTVCSRGI